VPKHNANPDKFRKRIELEDELLNSRTTIFLATNGLWAAAVGISNDPYLMLGMGTLGILVSTMWLMCAWQSWRVIRALTIQHRKHSHDEVDEVVGEALWCHLCRPTNILAQWLPGLFLAAWIVFLAWRVCLLF
jgi:hypothetical protein